MRAADHKLGPTTGIINAAEFAEILSTLKLSLNVCIYIMECSKNDSYKVIKYCDKLDCG